MSLDIIFTDDKGKEIISHNITHNLTSMASALSEDAYKALWRPEELAFFQQKPLIAKNLQPFYEYILNVMASNKAYFETFNSQNGWGTYENFIQFLIELLTSCYLHPNSIIEVSR